MRKGQIETAVVGFFIIGLVVFGTISSREILSENRYVGDSSKNITYDLLSCRVTIEEKNLMRFENKDEALVRGYKIVNCR